MFIKVKKIVETYPNIPMKGVIHIGAHEAEEYEAYKEAGMDKQVWVEANPVLAEGITSRFSEDNNIRVFNEAIYDSENEMEFKISNNGQSSSLLELGEHKRFFPTVHYIDKFKLVSKRFDNLISEENINVGDYNFLNVDIQGADLNAIMSFNDHISHMDFIYSEFNTVNVYEGCHLIGEMDEYLKNKGFTRTLTHEYQMDGANETITPIGAGRIPGHWGDALYVKTSLL